MKDTVSNVHVADRFGPWMTSPRFDTAQTRKQVRSRTEAAQYKPGRQPVDEQGARRVPFKY